MTQDSGDQNGVEQAVEAFLSDKSMEYADSTIYSYRSRLGKFVEFCHEKDIGIMSELSHFDIDAYKQWRFTENHSLETVKTQMDSLRMFVEWCADRQYVIDGLADVCDSPNTRGSQRSDIVRRDRQKRIVEHLEQFNYASKEHVIIALLSHTGLRAGAIRAIDTSDIDFDQKSIEIVHRPPATPLKNGTDGQRQIAISSRICDILADYIDTNHIEHNINGRTPLLATQHGRISRTAVRETAYRWTQPCQIGSECPHGRDPTNCEWTARNHASKCPSSSATHAFRRGVITSLLNSASEEIVGGRCDVSKRVMDAHYDQRSENEKMEKRRDELGIN
jgi:site-specific recombinase XerD